MSQIACSLSRLTVAAVDAAATALCSSCSGPGGIRDCKAVHGGRRSGFPGGVC